MQGLYEVDGMYSNLDLLRSSFIAMFPFSKSASRSVLRVRYSVTRRKSFTAKLPLELCMLDEKVELPHLIIKLVLVNFNLFLVEEYA